MKKKKFNLKKKWTTLLWYTINRVTISPDSPDFKHLSGFYKDTSHSLLNMVISNDELIKLCNTFYFYISYIYYFNIFNLIPLM